MVTVAGDPPMSWETVSIAIGGMTCGACAARIERRLNDLDGVAATVNYASERARVRCRSTYPCRRWSRRSDPSGIPHEVVRTRRRSRIDTEEVDRRARSLGRRLVVAAVLFMPLCDFSIAFSLVPSLRFSYWQWVLVVLAAPVLTWGAWPFYKAAIRNARHGTSSMDTLVSMGIAGGDRLVALRHVLAGHQPCTPDGLCSCLLTNQAAPSTSTSPPASPPSSSLAGISRRGPRRRTGNALRSLAAVGAKDVAVLDATGAEQRIPIAQLVVGDRFVVRPGETVATDGEVVFGHSAIDRSAMTGESLPVDVMPGDDVVGGTVSVGGRLVVRPRRSGTTPSSPT